MGLEEDKRTVSGCMDCKYRHPLKRTCMLGRDPVNCKTPQARRGDQELYGRILELGSEELERHRAREAEQRRRVERVKQNLGILRDSDWS